MTFPTEEQANYIKSSIEKNVYLEACPGSGKTEVIAAKVANEIESWRGFPGGIAVLSFANSAAEELRIRLIKYIGGEGVSTPHWLSTIDSFIFKFIVSPVAHLFTGYAGKNNDLRVRIVDGSTSIFYRTKYALERTKISANQYDFDTSLGRFLFKTGIAALDRKLNSLVLLDWQFKDLLDTKKRFWAAGYATYRDIELLAVQVLTDARTREYCERIALRFPCLVVDECQDLSIEQLNIFEGLHRYGVHLHFVGDLNQSIYGFRHANPGKVKEFIGRLDFECMPLVSNFRSSQAIVNLCCKLVPAQLVKGNVDIQSLSSYIVQYQKCPSETLPKFLELAKLYSNNVVVARGHSSLQKFCSSASLLSNTEKLALGCVLAAEKGSYSLRKSLELFSRWLANNAQYSAKPNAFYCPVDFESELAWRLFLHECLFYLKGVGASSADQTWKVWCKLAKKALRELPAQSFVTDEIRNFIGVMGDINLKSPAGIGDQLLSLRLSVVDLKGAGVRLATIHEIKGETHEATMLVSSSQRGQQSHWREWIADKTSEAARLAYVASSRPQSLLVWSVKALKKGESIELEKLGFVLV